MLVFLLHLNQQQEAKVLRRKISRLQHKLVASNCLNMPFLKKIFKSLTFLSVHQISAKAETGLGLHRFVLKNI